MPKMVGVITIGQTPRVDMIQDIRKHLPEGTRILEKGVLDGKTVKEIQELLPEEGHTVLISRMRNGESATMAKEKVIPIIQGLVDELHREGVSLIILACTGKFPLFKSEIPIIYPDHLLNFAVKGLLREGPLAVIVPLPEQGGAIIDKWKEAGFHAIHADSSPYEFSKENMIEAVRRLDRFPAMAIVLDCMGYTEEMKSIAQAHTTKPVILSRSVIFGLAGELI
ncbi:AroM protein [Neobacillus piezotolerans]|uniref:AroM protein n=1 Tax=Neobacillus piezotolerans TaxID=2259171 RepID=A0A3D8GLT9_9BACI|nr:AroM family protein [Neobacillus piezotolerans]RDU35247.1 AroM protein [Neobacillus piezotolerans]